VVIRRVGGSIACHVMIAKAVVESLCWKQTRTVMKYQLCLSLIDLPSECLIPNLDCIVWWKFVYGKIACLGEWFIIVFMTAFFGSCLLSGQTYPWRFGERLCLRVQGICRKIWLKWQCVEFVFGMCFFSSFGQGADYPDGLFVVFVGRSRQMPP